MLRVIALVLATTLSCASARADAVGPPVPRECPGGAIATTNHCGTVCVVDACTADGDCDPGERCGSASLCTEDVGCGGWGGTYTIVHASCGGGCPMGACRAVQACVGGTTPDGGRAAADGGTRGEHVTWGCGCRAPAGTSRGPAVVLWAVMLAALTRRRGARR